MWWINSPIWRSYPINKWALQSIYSEDMGGNMSNTYQDSQTQHLLLYFLIFFWAKNMKGIVVEVSVSFCNFGNKTRELGFLIILIRLFTVLWSWNWLHGVWRLTLFTIKDIDKGWNCCKRSPSGDCWCVCRGWYYCCCET